MLPSSKFSMMLWTKGWRPLKWTPVSLTLNKNNWSPKMKFPAFVPGSRSRGETRWKCSWSFWTFLNCFEQNWKWGVWLRWHSPIPSRPWQIPGCHSGQKSRYSRNRHGNILDNTGPNRWRLDYGEGDYGRFKHPVRCSENWFQDR